MSTTVPTNDGPIFFFMPHETPYGFLSQWYECPFTAPSVDAAAQPMTFTTAEQYMMYHKAILFHDEEVAKELMLTTSPKKQKALGRKVKGFDNATWNANRERIVEEGNWNKFCNAKNEVGLKQLLLDTGERELVETSPYDRIWGVGYGAANAEKHRDSWGANLLGKAITEVRARLRMQVEAQA